MTRSLGKMSAYPLMDWRDQAKDSVDQDVQAFLQLGEGFTS